MTMWQADANVSVKRNKILNLESARGLPYSATVIDPRKKIKEKSYKDHPYMSKVRLWYVGLVQVRAEVN